jgi:hypothetical protein
MLGRVRGEHIGPRVDLLGPFICQVGSPLSPSRVNSVVGILRIRGPTCTKRSLPALINRYAVGRLIPVASQNSLTLTQMRAIGSRARGPRLFCRIGECSIDIGNRRIWTVPFVSQNFSPNVWHKIGHAEFWPPVGATVLPARIGPPPQPPPVPRSSRHTGPSLSP